MVQVLEPSMKQRFASQFAQALGGNVGQGLGEGFLEKIQQRKLLKSQSAENEFLKRMGLDLSGVTDPKIRETIIKEESKKKRFADIFGRQSNQGEPSEGMMELSPEQETILALQDPTAFNAYKHLKESRQKVSEGQRQQENLKSTLESMTETLLGGKLGYTPGRFLTSKGRRDAQYFDTLNTQLESIGKEMVSKGVLSAPRFAFLLANLPSSDKTDATNAGALEAWYEELGIPMSEDVSEKLKSLYEEKPKKKPKPKPKTDEKSSSFMVMRDASGAIYDIPLDMVEEATAQGLVAE